jgi:hypothetical protein
LKKIIHDKLELNFLTKLKINKTFIKGLRKRKKNQNTKNKEDKVIHLGREEREKKKLISDKSPSHRRHAPHQKKDDASSLLITR